MFAEAAPPQAYADPWLASTQERLTMLARGERRVAYYYEEPNTSTFRYRAYNMAQVLNAQPGSHYSASWFFRRDLAAMQEIVDRADVLVVCRSGYEHRLARLIERFARLRKPVLFDVDDLVIDTEHAHLLINTLGLDKDDPGVWDHWFGLLARLRATLERCDRVITTNAFLAQRIHESTGKPAVVVPNFMNREQLAISKRLWTAKRDAGFGRITPPMLGYFSGTPSHRLDYAVAEPAIARLMERRDDLGLMLVGFIEPGPALTRFSGRIRREPFMDWINLQRLIASVEVNLMPLQTNVFTHCKSPLKYFEAAAVGTVSVASPTVNHVAAIKDGTSGRIARGHEWEEQIDAVLDDRDSYRVMAENAHEDAIENHAWTAQLPALLQALGWH